MKLTHREIALGIALQIMFSLMRKTNDKKDILEESINIMDHMGITDITIEELDEMTAKFSKILPEIRLYMQSKIDLKTKKDLLSK